MKDVNVAVAINQWGDKLILHFRGALSPEATRFVDILFIGIPTMSKDRYGFSRFSRLLTAEETSDLIVNFKNGGENAKPIQTEEG